MFDTGVSPWLQAALIGILLTNLSLLAAERQVRSIRLAGVQGLVLGLLPLLAAGADADWRLAGLALIFLAVKAWALPRMLRTAHAALPPSRPLAPHMGYTRGILAGIAGIVFSLWLGQRLPAPANPLFLTFFAPAFATILTGLLLIVTRRKALAQVIGYLVMENGIYLLGIPLAHHDALWLELCILLDIFAGIFVMILAVRHINRAFATTDVDHFASLRD